MASAPQNPRGEMVEATRAVVAAAEAVGVAVQPILADFGVDRATLQDPSQRLSLGRCDGLWERLTAAAADPDLPLRAVEYSPFGNFQVIDFLGANSPTVGAGVEALSRYFHMIHPHLRLGVGRDGALHTVRTYAESGDSQAFALAMVLRRFSHITGGWLPDRVTLRRAPTRDPALAARLFGPTVQWGQREDCAWLTDSVWRRPIPNADPRLARMLADYADSLGPAPSGLEGRVRTALDRLLPSGHADIDHVAPTLGMSRRTLQRRLGEEGLSFRTILGDLRQNRALRLLQDPALTLVEVALLLGYADETAFQRAFRRWRGTSPGRWRRARA